MSVDEALGVAGRTLAAAGVADAALDAETLLRHVLGWDRARVVTEGREALAPDAQARFRELVEARAGRRPLQYLTGVQAFWHREFRVTPDVLIPRPETELLVEAALERLRGLSRPVVVDVGTGSGCIAISLAAELPDAEVHAVDVSAAALAVARDNARRLGVNVVFHEGDLLEPVVGLAGRVDLVASNPPYVDASELSALEPEVRDHEPGVALMPSGGDRYAAYRLLAPAAARVLVTGGWLLLEIGRGMQDEVAGLCGSAGLVVEAVLADLQSIPRTIVARYPRSSHSP